MLKSLRLKRKEIETSGEELSLILKRKTLWLETKQAQEASRRKSRKGDIHQKHNEKEMGEA